MNTAGNIRSADENFKKNLPIKKNESLKRENEKKQKKIQLQREMRDKYLLKVCFFLKKINEKYKNRDVPIQNKKIPKILIKKKNFVEIEKQKQLSKTDLLQQYSII